MRPDMARVVTERPRWGHEAPSRKFGRRLSQNEIRREQEDDSALAGFVAWSRLRNRDAKTLSDVLGPLRKYLRRQVGRPWDKVWSELCANLDRRTVAGIHIFDHIRQEVVLHATVAEDGRVLARSRWSRDLREVDGLYVHPRTRLLCVAGRRKPRPRYRETRFRAALEAFGIRRDSREQLAAYRIDGNNVWERKGTGWILHRYEKVPGRRALVLVHSKQASQKEMQAVGSWFLARSPF
jgi:hypothetical protein